MPIHCPIRVAVLDAESFEHLDYRVMGHAYKSQNELGRLCDEGAYEADLKARLLADGFESVQTQVPVTVTHRDFAKEYRIDLIADHAVYELKADITLAAPHETQLLHYMFLLGVQRGKLLNFRSPQVQGKIMVTSLTPDERRRFTLVTERWAEITSGCAALQRAMIDLLADWGAFLDTALYQEALIHLLGGTDMVERRIPLHRHNLQLGTQRMHAHAPGAVFRLTSLTDSKNLIERHLHRLLRLTDLKAIQWINLNHAKIEFTTITR